MLLAEDFFLVGFFLLAAGWVLAIVRKVKPFPIFFWSLVYCYTMLVLGITQFPIPYQEAESLIPVPHNFIPFHTIRTLLTSRPTSTAFLQIGGNILLAVPYGIILSLTNQEKRKQILFFPILFPLIVEFLQLFIGLLIGAAYRSIDIDDFLLNSLGGYLGILFSSIVLKKYKRGIRRKLFTK